MANQDKAEKQYGLIIPKKQQPMPPKAGNIFGDDNGSDEEDGTDWVKKALKAEGEKNKIKKQTKLSMQKALKEDPTIYQYDEVYDDMDRTKNQTKDVKDEKKKPKYIQNLLKAAERRKKEQEHRIERMVQKEREAEGMMYADKESFVTSAYREKLEEFKKMEEEEARMDKLEAIADVTKQQDMSGFYRHLYEQTIEKPKLSEGTSDLKRNELNNTDESKNLHENVDTNVNHDKELEVSILEKAVGVKTKKSRQYRQRVLEADGSDSEIETKQETKKKTKLMSPTKNKNIEQDIKEPDSKIQKQQIENSELNKEQKKITVEETSNLQISKNAKENKENNTKTDDVIAAAKLKAEVEKRERSKIWKKRTIGPAFEAAVQRYYARKAMRLSIA